MTKKPLSLILGPTRPPFLLLGPACVFLGIAAALWLNHSVINAGHAILCLVAAVLAHVSVNTLNEYYDFKSGLDYETQRTPFSGGSGTLPAHPELANSAKQIGWVSFILTAIIGIYFITVRGWWLLPLGILGLLLVYTYTKFLNRLPLLCLLAPGLGFGIVMVMGTIYVLTGAYSWTALFASLIPFFLVSNLLLLNQFPDVPADQKIGRMNYPIVAGKKASALIYTIFMMLTYVSIVSGVALNFLPLWALLGLGSMLIAIPTVRGVVLFAQDEVGRLIPFMGMNVVITLLTPVLMGIGLLIGG